MIKKKTKLQIKKMEKMIKKSKKYLMWLEEDLMLVVKEMNKKQAWVNIEKTIPTGLPRNIVKSLDH